MIPNLPAEGFCDRMCHSSCEWPVKKAACVERSKAVVVQLDMRAALLVSDSTNEVTECQRRLKEWLIKPGPEREEVCAKERTNHGGSNRPSEYVEVLEIHARLESHTP